MKSTRIVALIAVLVVATTMLLGKNAARLRLWSPVSSIAERSDDKRSLTSSTSDVTTLATLKVDYPEDATIFPPDMQAPLFTWHDAEPNSRFWHITFAFADGTADVHAASSGPPPQIGEIDPQCISKTNELPTLTPSEAASHTWRPDEKSWAAILAHAVTQPATVTITGFASMDHPLSRGKVTIQVSNDPVGAPIFYRDVPLMPTETDPGVIRPLAKALIPLINWRLRNVGDPQSRLLLTQMHTCANCHSFSADGKTLGMDLDGPRNNKALYAIAAVAPQTTISNQNVISWNAIKNKPVEKWKGTGLRYGFMSRVSPDGQYVVTTLNSQIYVSNFTDYRFSQVFYPTRGLLASYSKATNRIELLPGADDRRYVQTGANWYPDGKQLVFSRAEAKEAYPEGRPLAKYANDPNEIPIQYDLYRIPFNEGKGGQAVAIVGASHNGMSNSFPKVSPDGRWIVFVQCRNGQLMRPDGKLYIIPAEGGQARLMRCNTQRMNSWHSFSPNGRWLVFSSKGRTPYTQMFLTHLDGDGNDSPAILIENSTAANRAVNIPEFVNVSFDGFKNIDVPAADAYRHFDMAIDELDKNKNSDRAMAEFRKSIEIEPQFSEAHNNLGIALAARGLFDEAITHYKKALEIEPDSAEVHSNLGVALGRQGHVDEAIAQFRKALEINPNYADAHNNLGFVLSNRGHEDEAITQFQKALEIKPDYAEAHNNLGLVLASYKRAGGDRIDEAIAHYRKAIELKPAFAQAHSNLGVALFARGQVDEAIAQHRKAVEIEPRNVRFSVRLADALASHGQIEESIALYRKALKIDSADADAHNNLGLALAGHGQVDEAIVQYRKALEVKPNYAAAHNNLGMGLAGLGQFDEAIAHYEKALQIRPDFAEAHNNLGVSLAAGLGQMDAAIIHFQKAIEINPAYTGARQNLDHARSKK